MTDFILNRLPHKDDIKWCSLTIKENFTWFLNTSLYLLNNVWNVHQLPLEAPEPHLMIFVFKKNLQILNFEYFFHLPEVQYNFMYINTQELYTLKICYTTMNIEVINM